jgi:hypothetical protein
MTSKKVGEYEIEYSGARLLYGDGWGAWVAVYAPSSNPMHRNCIFPSRRVAIETTFPDQKSAEEHAEKIAMSLIK